MAFKNLNHFIQSAENIGELTRIKEFVSPELEIAEITDRICKVGGNALLFENNGTEFPLLINLFGSEKRMCLSLGINNLDEIGNQMDALFKQIVSPKEGLIEKLRMLPTLNEISSWMPKHVKGRGACQEVVMEKPDVTKLPVLKCWVKDGGPFITLPVVNTIDPETKIRNVGMYRMQVFSETMTGMHWHKHKGSAHHYLKYKELGIKMPVSVILGGDPAYTYSATAPLPENIDEYILAGFLRKKKVELVKCLTNDIEVPADADFVIEGYVDPAEELIYEGPFGDHTGYYSLPDYYPRFHVTCITHRKNAIYPTTIVGIPPQEDGWIGKATERIFLTPIKMSMVPEIVDMEMPVEGVFHNITIIKIKKLYAGQAFKAMNSLWGAGQMMFNKIMIVVDDTVDVHDYKAVTKAVSEKVNVNTDILLMRGPLDVLDHASKKMSFGGKIGIDATTKLHEEIAETNNNSKPNIEVEKILSEFPAIKSINASLINENIKVVIFGIDKTSKEQTFEMITSMLEKSYLNNVKFAFFLEHNIDVNDFSDVVWRLANNIDPQIDCKVISKNKEAVYVVDGTRKTKEVDDFSRDWPNIIVADDATIAKVDELWPKLGLGDFVKSPSLKYKNQIYGLDAVAERK